MLNWLFDWLNKFLEDNPSGEEQAFWSFFKENAVVVNRIHFVPFSKLLEAFYFEDLFKLCKKLERRDLILLGCDGLYATRKGERILKKMPEPSKLPAETNTENNFVINADDIRRLFRPDDE